MQLSGNLLLGTDILGYGSQFRAPPYVGRASMSVEIAKHPQTSLEGPKAPRKNLHLQKYSLLVQQTAPLQAANRWPPDAFVAMPGWLSSRSSCAAF